MLPPSPEPDLLFPLEVEDSEELDFFEESEPPFDAAEELDVEESDDDTDSLLLPESLLDELPLLAPERLSVL